MLIIKIFAAWVLLSLLIRGIIFLINILKEKKYQKTISDAEKAIEATLYRPSLKEKISEDYRNNRTIYVFFTLVLLTMAEIYFIYGELLFSRWAWLRAAILISLITCSLPYVIVHEYYKEVGMLGDLLETGIFLIIIGPIEVMLIYPGTNVLGINSDDHFIPIILALVITHGIGFHIIEKGLLKEKMIK